MQNREEFIKNPQKSLLKVAWPIILGMLAQLVYNITDTAFVGHLGTREVAAITFAFPLFFILMALNVGLGTGVNSRISRYIGEKNATAAANTALHGIIISIALSILIIILGYLSIEPLFKLFGAEKEVLALAMDYMQIILIGIIFMFPGFVIHHIFGAQGQTKITMKVQIASVALNIILDPIFIYTLGLGIKGAALATLTSFIFTFIISIAILKKSDLKINLKALNPSRFIATQIIKIGLPQSLMMLLISLYIIIINRFMAHFGTSYVATFGIASRVENIIFAPIIGLAMAMMTLVGTLYGAKEYNKLKELARYGIKKAILIGTIIGIIVFATAPLLVRIFTTDQNLINLAIPYIRIDAFTFPLMAISAMIARIMPGMGYGLPGFIIQLVRTILVTAPLSYLLIFVLDKSYLCIPITMIAGGLAAVIIGATWLQIKFKKLKEKTS